LDLLDQVNYKPEDWFVVNNCGFLRRDFRLLCLGWG